jgi:hypothetical protein
MKVAILAGGVGSRLSEETVSKPKPMVEIGGYSILWHIMKHYVQYDFEDFAIALGYKGEYIKRYFHNFCNLSGNLVSDMEANTMDRMDRSMPNWRVNLIETGTFAEVAFAPITHFGWRAVLQLLDRIYGMIRPRGKLARGLDTPRSWRRYRDQAFENTGWEARCAPLCEGSLTAL